MQLRFGWTWRDGTGEPSCSVFLAGEPDAGASELLEVTELATGADDSRL